MKRVDEPIKVHTQNGWPVRFQRGNVVVCVRDVLRIWVYQTRWWSEEKRRENFLLETDGGTFHIYRSGDRWRLARTMD